MRRWQLRTSAVLALCMLGCNALDDSRGAEPPFTRERPGPGDVPKVESSDEVDLLFVVDDSNTMVQEQAALRAQFPRLITALVTGDSDGDGAPERGAVSDLHLGVVSTDMGLVGIPDIDRCSGFGDDGVLRHEPSSTLGGCEASYPPFLSYSAEREDDPERLASDFACIATLGTSGCGFEQPLEAALKALWPEHDPFPLQDGDNRVRFLGDANGSGWVGHGDNDNLGFLRNDPAQGLSIVAVIVVSDEDDCSARRSDLFTPPTLLDPADPQQAALLQQSLNLRCPLNADLLYEPSRYTGMLRALRPNNEQLVVFAAITGVPPETADEAALAATDFADADQRAAFYRAIHEHPAMQLAIDDNGTADPMDDALVPSCQTDQGKAYPPWRLVDVAEGFGSNGLVQSICAADGGTAVDAIARLIAQHLPGH